jgi:hypothetical protein
MSAAREGAKVRSSKDPTPRKLQRSKNPKIKENSTVKDQNIKGRHLVPLWSFALLALWDFFVFWVL